MAYNRVELEASMAGLAPQNVQQALSDASYGDQKKIQAATRQLQEWETQTQYFSHLMTVFVSFNSPIEVRQLAAIQLKNGIAKYWRKSAKNVIRDEEKEHIRSICLDAAVNEPDHRLVLQSALMIAKIVRFDYPREWPDAMPSIVRRIQQATQQFSKPAFLRNTLTILLYIIKECASAQLLRSKATISSVAPEIMQILGGIYVSKVNTWLVYLRSGAGGAEEAYNCSSESLLTLRVIRRLMIMAYEYPNEDSSVLEFWDVARLDLVNVLPLVLKRTAADVGLYQLAERHLIQIAKLHLDMVKAHPTGFAFLPESINIARAYWGLIKEFGPSFGVQSFDKLRDKLRDYEDGEEDGVNVIETLVLKGMLLLRACTKMVFNPAKTFTYSTPEMRAKKSFAIETIKTELLTEGFAREVMETVVPQYFVFRLRDLQEWEEEPEEWESREEGESESWEFSIRSCAEKFFLELFIYYKGSLVPPLLDVFQSAASVRNTNVALKDSVYTAIGLGAPVLEDKLDFATFLTSTLVPEIQSSTEANYILRRRIAIVLGQWLPVKSGLDRPLVYQIFQHLLAPKDNDKIVRITAGRQLKNIVDPFEFDAEQFKPLANLIIERLLILVNELELTDTKMALLNTLSVIVIRMENKILDFSDMIMSYLSMFWNAAGEEYLLKQSILGIIAAIVTSNMRSSSKYHALIIPLIRDSVTVDSPTRTYLLEDATDLWSKVLDQTSSSSPELTSLAGEHLFPMFTVASETLRTALDITESYITLIPHEILASAVSLLSALNPLLGGLKARDTYHVTNLIELLIRVALLTDGIMGLQTFTSALLSSNTLYIILSSLQTAYEAHQTTGPNSIPSPLDPLVEIDYISILARLAAADPQLFISAVTAVSPLLGDGGGEPFHTTIDWLLSEWTSYIDNMGHPDRKKLSALALTSLFTTAEPWMLSRLQELMSIWTETITELIDEESGQDTMVSHDIETGRFAGETAKDERMRHVGFEDVVRRVDIKVFVREAVQSVLQRVGVEAFQGYAANVDKDVVAAFQNLGVV